MTTSATEGMPGIGRVVVVVPTYQERENVRQIVTGILAAAPAVEVLVADDDSPDGTGEVADALAAADDRVHVLHRPGKAGLGAAYLAGFAWGEEHGADVLVEMDADGSHRAEDLPKLLDALVDADVVLGSRWVPGGTVVNWPRSREVLSRGGNLYTRLALGIPLRDATGGFRAYRRSALDKIGLADVASQGYCFQVDLAWRAVRAGLRVVEVPITFVERERGESKMSRSIVTEALWRVTVWGARDRARRLAGAGAAEHRSRRSAVDARPPRGAGRHLHVVGRPRQRREPSRPAVRGVPRSPISAPDRSSSRRSVSSSSSSSVLRRSRSMSQCVRTGFVGLTGVSTPSRMGASAPHFGHCQRAGISASCANGIVTTCPSGHSKDTVLRATNSTPRSSS